MKDKKFLKRIELLNIDHKPEGWPAIKMKDISRLLKIIKEQQLEIDMHRFGWDNK